ncbi:MAG TPA: type II secretion system minor pseudopilin GspK [Steroidobacteraceae bacterium]|nr:type II secretion system minor pseudopilin GspK [Steroidobacteraceae bacterium]
MPRTPHAQRGIALLTAVILVAIAAVLATAIAFASAMSARRASTVFGADQGLLAAEGAEAMAAYLLTQAGANHSEDALNQPWAQSYGPLQLLPGVMLEYAQLEDQQGKFNINDLAPDGSTSQAAVTQFGQLLERVGIETKWASLIADWIDADNQPNFPDGAEDSVYLSQTPAYRPPNLPVTSISELLALPGFGRDRYNRLLPYIAALPPGTAINTCTAPGVVLDGLSGKTEYSNTGPQQLLAHRQAEGCFPTTAVFQASLADQAKTAGGVGVQSTSQYFRLRSVISIGTARFSLYSLFVRDGAGQIHVVLRTFGTE